MNIKDTGKPFDIPGWGTGTEKVIKSFPLEDEVQYLRIIQERIREKRHEKPGCIKISNMRAIVALENAIRNINEALENMQ